MINTSDEYQKDTLEKAFAEVRYNEEKKGKALYAIRSFESGEIITPFHAEEIFTKPNYLTVQLDEFRHIKLAPDCLANVNHSCAPNIFFDTTNMVVQTLKNIEVGDELTFFYPSTEWDMDRAFECRCGAENCLHQIRGAKYIAPKILEQYRLTDFVSSLIH